MDREMKIDDKRPEKVLVRDEAKVSRLLAQAAQAAVAAGVPPEAFTNAAWQAYLRASPGLVERLAEMQLDAMLEEMRSAGRLAKA
jgi:hypothetical protein